MTIADLDPANWGNAAGWVAAIGTVCALLIAALALRTELGDRQAERESARRAEARKVSMPLFSVEGPKGGELDALVVVRNDTDEMIYEVVVDIISSDGRYLGRENLIDIGPEETTALRRHPVGQIDDPSSVVWTMVWRDADDQSWVRTSRGEVRRWTG